MAKRLGRHRRLSKQQSQQLGHVELLKRAGCTYWSEVIEGFRQATEKETMSIDDDAESYGGEEDDAIKGTPNVKRECSSQRRRRI